MAGYVADQNSLIMQQWQQLTSEIKETAEEIKKAYELQESAKSDEEKATAALRLQHYREKEKELIAERKELSAQRGTGGAPGSTGDVKEHLRMLLPQPPATWPQDAAAVRRYLNDHSNMCIPVTGGKAISAVVQEHPYKLQVVHASELAAAFTTYITAAPVNRFSEVTTTCVVNEAYKTTIEHFSRLDDTEPFAPQFFGNRSVSKGSSSTGSFLVKKRKRPDSFLVVNNLTLLVGEDKQTGEMSAALDDIKAKLEHVAMDYYAGSSFLIAYTAAGTHMQFYSIFFQGGSPEVEPATNELDLATNNHRVYMILVMAKLYVLLKHMAEQRHGPYPLFHKMKRPEDTTITFLPNTVEKRIRRCAQFFSRFCTTKTAVGKAYRAAEEEKKVAEAARRPATLITAADPPAEINGTWCAQLHPLLYNCAEPRTEQDLLDIGFALCTAAAALHKEGVVHRDFRLKNVMQHKNGRNKVVIDLELAAEANKVAEMKLCDWDDNTLEDGRYTFKSDMYQIGVLLERHSKGVPCLSQQALEFFTALKARTLTATDALSHSWLLSRRKPEEDHELA